MNLFKYILLLAQIILIFHFGQDKKSKIEGYYQATDHYLTGIVLYNDGFYCSFDHISLQWYYSVGSWTSAGDTVYLKEIEIIKDSLSIDVETHNESTKDSLINFDLIPYESSYHVDFDKRRISSNRLPGDPEPYLKNPARKVQLYSGSAGRESNVVKIIDPDYNSIKIFADLPPSPDNLSIFNGTENKYIFKRHKLLVLNNHRAFLKKVDREEFYYLDELKRLIKENDANVIYGKNYTKFFRIIK